MRNTKPKPELAINPISPTPDALVSLAKSELLRNKADDIVTIDLKGKSDIADYMIIASATSNRHAASLAENVVEKLRGKGIYPIATEGLPECDWVLIDNPYVIVHIMKPETRSHYNLEKMWLV